jgi:hypothetical protein
MGNIHGRFEPANSTDKALLIGSHMVRTINCVFRAVILSVIKEPSLIKNVLYQDTVIDAGMYDGALGIVCAISALKVLKVTGKLERLTRPVEVREFSIVSKFNSDVTTLSPYRVCLTAICHHVTLVTNSLSYSSQVHDASHASNEHDTYLH